MISTEVISLIQHVQDLCPLESQYPLLALVPISPACCVMLFQVLIGDETDSLRQVGYIFNTHLQAYQGKGNKGL